MISTRVQPGWRVVAGKELREAWSGGRPLALLLGYALFMSGLTFLLATDKELSLLAQRDAATLSIQLAILVGALLAMISSADALSGERERSTMESLLTTPTSRRDIILGKALAGIAFWFASYAVLVPYVWVLASGAGILANALLLTFLLGTALSLLMMGIGILVSSLSESNRTSLSVSLFLFLVLAAPTQLPGTTLSGAVGQTFLKFDPLTAASKAIDNVLAKNHAWADGAVLPLLLSPAIWATVIMVVLLAVAPRNLTFLRKGGA